MTATHPQAGDGQRVQVPDVAAVRRSPGRLIRSAIVVLILLTFFTAGGISLVRAGELPGLPFAIGGAIAQLAVIVFLVTTLRVRATLTGDTVSRQAMSSARRTFAVMRVGLFIVVAGLLVYAIVRAVQGDGWTLVPTLIVSAVLWLLARGMARLRTGLENALASH
jgi:hypothetical protein